MTVIAFDGKAVAADKRCSFPGKHTTVTKIFRNGPDEIVAVYGAGFAVEFAREWLAQGKPAIEFPKNLEDCTPSFAVIHRNGTVARYEGTRYPLITDPQLHYTEGSGRDYASAAMHLGCDAKRAVEVACELCQECGNGVDVLTFD